ncbi:MFS transporter [Bacteroidia bacterium]|nr:MFS transporter [Bacteroidia bacterium]
MGRIVFIWSRSELRELIPQNVKGMTKMFSSLRQPNFRLYFFGQCISLFGTWVQAIAMSWLIYRLTGSIVLLTLVAFINQIPSLLITPYTGVLSDSLNRWKIIRWTQTLFMINAAALATLTLGGWIETWQLMIISGISGTLVAIEAPARQSFYTSLVPKEDMANAIALNSLTINGARFVGPAMGGLLIAAVGEGYCFLINAASFIAVLWALMAMKLPPFVRKTARIDVWKRLGEGVSYIRNFLPIKTVILFVAALSFFGFPFFSIMPALVKDILGGDSRMLGYFNSSLGLGTMAAALYLASRKKVTGLGKVATITSCMLGVSLILISFIRSQVVACIIGVPLGFALIGSMATANTLLQTMVDHDKRGRVMSFFTMAFAGMAPLGSLAFGFFAKTFSLQNALTACGIACVITCIVYEYFRPQVRAAATERNLSRQEKEGVVEEFATAIDNPF